MNVELLVGEFACLPIAENGIPTFADLLFSLGAEFVHSRMLLVAFLNPTDMEVVLTVADLLGEEILHFYLHVGVRESAVLVVCRSFALRREDIAVSYYDGETYTAAGVTEECPHVSSFGIEGAGCDSAGDKILIHAYARLRAVAFRRAEGLMAERTAEMLQQPCIVDMEVAGGVFSLLLGHDSRSRLVTLYTHSVFRVAGKSIVGLHFIPFRKRIDIIGYIAPIIAFYVHASSLGIAYAEIGFHA